MEIHYNPHDVRQIWIRLPDGELTEISWIHRDHLHQPFNDHTWQHIRTHAHANDHDDSQQHETGLADALDLQQHKPGTLPAHAAYLHQRTASRIGSLSSFSAAAPE
ncbi:hypothetical protein [Streptomyces sp. NPDC029041]|uniref:hypothetical protein n=1 Tax=Streptomyces sp. NPDC029041 TaxID=3155727 RepID=UPI0033C0054B